MYLVGGALKLSSSRKESPMNNIIWLVGAVVIVLAVLGFFGLG
jgi:hypothetical protein